MGRRIKTKKAIWPLRFRIQVLKVLSTDKWEIDRIKIDDFNIFLQTSLQLLKQEHVQEIFKRAEKLFGFGNFNLENLFSGATIIQPLVKDNEKGHSYIPLEKTLIKHEELKKQIAEIGKLQLYYTQTEYPIELVREKKNLDVVWKREIDGVPTYAFEIELSGMFEKTIRRLEFAFRRWNSEPRIVIPQEDIDKVYNVLTTTDRDFIQKIKIYEPNQIIELFYS
ncbi:MAG: hypothetical protein NC827_05540 [Candidatus Omnitrophica bacterium]|nr:hypothetical protein [Candidatus Omnitrophota bacterium]MCM8802753.1 hypothetical protein [Candidatus Omnitrophota bacterium]